MHAVIDAAEHAQSSLPPVRGEAQRRRDLAAMKRRATGLLVAMSAAFVLVVVFGSGHGWIGYLQATLEASMVGGLADWFAVTALFRHPLGLPIPHTAVIRARKDEFGETLGSFVQENFLTAEVVAERVRATRVGTRVGSWLSDEANAAVVAEHASELAVALADLVRDEDVHRLLEEEVARAIDAVPLAPVAGRALQMLTASGRHQELLDAILRGLERFLDENRETLRSRFSEESPWWLPNSFEDRIFDRLLDGFRDYLRTVNRDPNHELRAQFDQRVADVADQLLHSPELLERGEQLKRDLLAHPELRSWSTAVWSDLKRTLRAQASDPESELRQRLTRAVVGAGKRLQADSTLQQKVDEVIEGGVRYIATHFRDEITGLVSGTIERWDPEETSDKLELLLGPDLQFIRINGTVVGGLAGLVIHALARVIG
ncbi:MAG: hypothetical protein QOI55_1612 [Actinomycetota bacterium]|nr:hypothetical protein [Actinomycetota bacterium]